MDHPMINCIFCLEKITEDWFMLALEKPYINLWVHKKCYNMNKNGDYLRLHPELITEYIKERGKIK